jgi:heme A synthase
MSIVGFVASTVLLETIPLNPYFRNYHLKITFEMLYMLILLHIVFSEFQKISDKRLLLRGKHKTWFNAVKQHYYSAHVFGSMFDLLNLGFGIALCVEWIVLVKNTSIVEKGMQALNRPSGDVQYDDTDADEWSVYHKDIVQIEHDVQQAIANMVKK